MSDDEDKPTEPEQVVPKTKGATLSPLPEEPKPPIKPTIRMALEDRDKQRSDEAKRIRERAMGKTITTPDGRIILVPED